MKKLISLVMALAILMSVAVVAVGAADPAKTAVEVKKGDEVVYALKLTVPEKVVGCDFSIYYDSSVLKIKKVADFTGNYDVDEHQAVINYNLKDEVRGNWSILAGVDFDERAIVKLSFEAVKDGTTNISYYVRYLFPDSLEMFTDYKFTCDVEVAGKEVISDAAPELNVVEVQSDGQFINSVTGDSEDADVNTAEIPQNNQGGSNGGDISENDLPADKANDNKNKPQATEKETDSKSEDPTQEQTTISTTGGTDAPTSVTATPSQTDDGGMFGSVWFWVIVVVVLVGGGAGIFYVSKNKKNADSTEEKASDNDAE